MSANCTRWMGLHSTFAPMSRSSGFPVSAGRTEMMAGRSTDGSRPSTKMAPAITAPEFPAETMPQASPRFTSSKQTRIELSFLRRIAWPGWSSIATTSEACFTAMGRSFPPPWRASCSRISGSGPTSTTATPWRAAATAPWTMSPGAWSPPMASTATGSACASLMSPRAYWPGVICSPLYVPQDGQARCESTGSLHFGHFVTLAGTILKFAARRRSRRMLDVRFLGTPTASLPSGLLLELLEPRPPRVRHVAIASAIALVQVRSAHGPESLAALLAHRIAGERQQKLLPHHRIEVDDLAGVSFFVHVLGVEATRLARPRAIVRPLVAAPAPRLRWHEGELEVERHLHLDGSQAAAARRRKRRPSMRFEQDPAVEAPQHGIDVHRPASAVLGLVPLHHLVDGLAGKVPSPFEPGLLDFVNVDAHLRLFYGAKKGGHYREATYQVKAPRHRAPRTPNRPSIVNCFRAPPGDGPGACRPRLRPHEAARHREERRLGLGRDVEFLVNAFHVGLHGALGDAERRRDIGVRVTVHEQLQHLQLALRERRAVALVRRVATQLPEEHLGRARADGCGISGEHLLDRARELRGVERFQDVAGGAGPERAKHAGRDVDRGERDALRLGELALDGVDDILSAHLRQPEVDQRDVRLLAAGERKALLAGAGGAAHVEPVRGEDLRDQAGDGLVVFDGDGTDGHRAARPPRREAS